MRGRLIYRAAHASGEAAEGRPTGTRLGGQIPSEAQGRRELVGGVFTVDGADESAASAEKFRANFTTCDLRLGRPPADWRT